MDWCPHTPCSQWHLALLTRTPRIASAAELAGFRTDGCGLRDTGLASGPLSAPELTPEPPSPLQSHRLDRVAVLLARDWIA